MGMISVSASFCLSVCLSVCCTISFSRYLQQIYYILKESEEEKEGGKKKNPERNQNGELCLEAHALRICFNMGAWIGVETSSLLQEF